MKTPENLYIKNPCPMAIEKMKENEQGWFCNGCQKQVYDFSKASKQEVNNLISRNSGEVCGLINEKNLVPVIRLPRFFARSRWLISLVGLLAVLITSCKVKKRTMGSILSCGDLSYYACTHMDTKTLTYAHKPNINDSLTRRKILSCLDSLKIYKD